MFIFKYKLFFICLYMEIHITDNFNIEFGNDINVKQMEEFLKQGCMCTTLDKDFLKNLINKGADKNLLLIMSVYYFNIDACKFLIEIGANMYNDNSKITSLHDMLYNSPISKLSSKLNSYKLMNGTSNLSYST